MKKLLLLAMLAVSSHSMAADYFNCAGNKVVLNENTVRVYVTPSSYKTFMLSKADGGTNDDFIADVIDNNGRFALIGREGNKMTFMFRGDGYTQECYFLTSDEKIKQRKAQAAADEIKRQKEAAQAEKEAAAARKVEEEKQRKAQEAQDKIIARNKALNDKILSGEQHTLNPVGFPNWEHGTSRVPMTYVCDLLITDIVSKTHTGPVLYEKNGVIINDYGPHNMQVSYKPLEGIHKTVRADIRSGDYTFAFKNGTLNFIDSLTQYDHPHRAYEMYNCGASF